MMMRTEGELWYNPSMRGHLWIFVRSGARTKVKVAEVEVEVVEVEV